MMEPQATFGPYQLLETLGRGATSRVFRATKPPDASEFALKILFPEATQDSGWVQRFRREVAALRKLQHRNIVGFLDAGEIGGCWYLAMDLVTGGSLRAVVGQRLHVQALARIAGQLASGLAEAHELGLVHRDLKPENILFASDRTLKIADWGLARTFGLPSDGKYEAGTSVTEVGMIVGPPRYMSPEQIRAETLTTNSDLFSLGICLFELAARRHPFPGESAKESMDLICNAKAPSLDRLRPDLPPAFNTLVTELMSIEASKRPTAKEVVKRMKPLCV